MVCRYFRCRQIFIRHEDGHCLPLFLHDPGILFQFPQLFLNRGYMFCPCQDNILLKHCHSRQNCRIQRISEPEHVLTFLQNPAGYLFTVGSKPLRRYLYCNFFAFTRRKQCRFCKAHKPSEFLFHPSLRRRYIELHNFFPPADSPDVCHSCSHDNIFSLIIPFY